MINITSGALLETICTLIGQLRSESLAFVSQIINERGKALADTLSGMNGPLLELSILPAQKTSGPRPRARSRCVRCSATLRSLSGLATEDLRSCRPDSRATSSSGGGTASLECSTEVLQPSGRVCLLRHVFCRTASLYMVALPVVSTPTVLQLSKHPVVFRALCS